MKGLMPEVRVMLRVLLWVVVLYALMIGLFLLGKALT